MLENSNKAKLTDDKEEIPTYTSGALMSLVFLSSYTFMDREHIMLTAMNEYEIVEQFANDIIRRNKKRASDPDVFYDANVRRN